jgi:hypothetical protein
MVAKITIFGHSFVRRLHKLMFSRQELQNLGLDSAQFHTSCIGIGSLRLQQKQRLHCNDHLLAGQDLVIIDIGCNDLYLENYEPAQFALDIVSYCSLVTEGLGVKRVAISQILTSNIEPFPGYIIMNMLLELLLQFNIYFLLVISLLCYGNIEECGIH